MSEESPLKDMKLKNMTFFLAWCRNHVHCDDCNALGAKPMRDRTFICIDCLRNIYHA